jgi:hypothetical protein
MRSRGLWSVFAVAIAAAVGAASCGTSHGSEGASGGGGSGSGASGGAALGGGSGSAAASGSYGVSAGGSSNGATPSNSAGGSGASLATPFAGSGNGGQSQLITTGISPKSCGPTSSFNGTTVTVTSGDNVTCFYSSSVSNTTPLAFVEQDDEIIGGKDLVHVRLTLNPDFVDNTYGANAIGWGGADAGGPGMGMGMHGHTFFDLIDSDHAEFDFDDASGNIVLAFDEDYCSADANAPSGYACLGVSGGDGAMIAGSASSIVYYGTSLDRDLNACGYSQYTTNSPATDAAYTPSPAAPDWDFRVVYDVWVLASVLPAGWTVSIPYVHASPSKLQATYTVTAAPCPPLHCVGEGCNPGGTCVGPWCDVGAGDASCVGEGCNGNGGCVGADCEGGTGGGQGGCVGEGCNSGGGCVGLLCDSGSPTECVGEACNDGGGATGGSWCLIPGSQCTDDSACCYGACIEGACNGTTPR